MRGTGAKAPVPIRKRDTYETRNGEKIGHKNVTNIGTI